MKYKKQLFDYAVKDYKRILKGLEYQSIFLIFDLDNEKALYSIAPLSQAIHELHSDLFVISRDKKCEEGDALRRIWATYRAHKNNKRLPEVKIFNNFVKLVNKKTDNTFERRLSPPILIIESTKLNLSTNKKLVLPYKYKWHKPHKVKQLNLSSKKILKYCFNIKPNETINLNVPLIPKESVLELPLEDYLDQYSIINIFCKEALKFKAKVKLTGTTMRVSASEPSEKISDLFETLQGCEYSIKDDSPIFKAYKDFSKTFKLNCFKPYDAMFILRPQGFNGKHLFGNRIGYPVPKSRLNWSTPRSMFMKEFDEEQSQFDPRDPQTRVALTETLPIDVFVDTTNIDYVKFRKRTRGIKKLLEPCTLINVVSHEKSKDYQTNLIVDITGRRILPDDSDVTTKVHPELYKKYKKKFGMYTNIPGGEVFTTPESMQGKFVGDVVMTIDRSVPLTRKDPIVVEIDSGFYKIVRAPHGFKERIEKVKEDNLEILHEKEKHKSLSKEIVEMQKANFNRIGEFAINTHPTAKLCDYLVVNEKIARMMHIALGTGFEKDRQTVYHMDIVFNAAKQKLDVYGITPQGKKVWILKKGRFVV